MDPSSLSGHSQSPDFGLDPGQPLLWSKLVARQGPYSGHQDLKASLIRRSGPLAAGRQLPPYRARNWKRKKVPGAGGRGVSPGRRRATRGRHPHGISPRKAMAKARVSRTAGGPRATWGTGGGGDTSLPIASQGSAPSNWAGGRRPRSDSRAKGVGPTPAAAQGSRALLHPKHVSSRLQRAA